MYKNIQMIFTILIVVGSLSAITVNESTGALTATSSATDFVGHLYSVGNQNVTLLSVNQPSNNSSGNAAVYAEVWTGNTDGTRGVLLIASPFIGFNAAFNYTLMANTNYVIGLNSNGSSYQFGFENPYGGFPISGIFGTINNSLNNNASNFGYSIGASNFTITNATVEMTASLYVEVSNATRGSATGNSSAFKIPANKTIAATANVGFVFSNWSITSGNCSIFNVSATTNAIFNSTTSDCTVRANFNITPPASNQSVWGSCQNISASGSYLMNGSINGTAYPAAAYDGCVNILASNVDFNCNGYSVFGNNQWETFGIYTGGSFGNKLTNITIRNCITPNWFVGAEFFYTENSTIRNVTASNNSSFVINYGSNNLLTDSYAKSGDLGFYGRHTSNTNLTNNTFVNATTYYGLNFDSWSGNNYIINNTIQLSSNTALNAIQTPSSTGMNFVGNTIIADHWVSSSATFNDTARGNIYYTANGTPSWSIYDISASSGTWADGGAAWPFSSSSVGAYWTGAAIDYRPYTLNSSSNGSANLYVNCGVGGSTCIGNSTNFTTPASKPITTSALSNYTFSNWTKVGNCTIINPTSSSTTVSITTSETCNVTANFVYSPPAPTPTSPSAYSVPDPHITGTISLLDFMNTITGGIFGIGIIIALSIIIFMSLFDRGFEEALLAASMFGTLIAIMCAWMGIVSPLWIVLFLAIACIAVILNMRKRG